MRILITGGCGFIGKHVAERFVREGHEVCILDNLSSGTNTDIPVKHRFFRLDVADRKCEEVFRGGSFDVVVHLAGRSDRGDPEDLPLSGTQPDTVGLVNMLRLSVKYKVRKFIYLSSAAVYGEAGELPLTEDAPCRPVTLEGVNKLAAEGYCQKWAEWYGLETVCLRCVEVYGPGQQCGVIQALTKAAASGVPAHLAGDPSSAGDYLDVRDVADAIYRASISHVSGVYNLSSMKPRRLDAIVELVRQRYPDLRVEYGSAPVTDPAALCLDHTRIKRDLDWVPIYEPADGISEICVWLEQKPAVVVPAKPVFRPKRAPGFLNRLKHVLPYAENMAVFLLLAYFTLRFDKIDVVLDYNIAYIVLFGIVYGFRQSFLSVILSSALLVYQQLQNGRDFLSMLYDPEMLFFVAVYLFFGLAVGHATDRKKQLLESKNNQLEAEREKLKFLEEVHKDTLEVKRRLQEQVVSNEDSLGKIYSIFKQMESLEPEQVIQSTVTVLEKIMRSRFISIYSVKPNAFHYIRLLVKSAGLDLSHQKSMKLSEHPELLKSIETKSVFVNRSLDPRLPMLAAPIVNGNDVVALVMIHHVEFERLTLYYENLFRICADLISASVSRAFRYVEATADRRYITGTPIIRASVFRDILEAKREAKRNLNIDFALLEIPVGDEPLSELAERLSSALRETDYLGMGENNRTLQVLLSNTSSREARFVMERLGRKGIRAVLKGETA